jgi:lantibiotic modifying enzyme
MTLSAADVEKIAAANPRAKSRELRRMLAALAEVEFTKQSGTPLTRICQAGADYGWRLLEQTANGGFAAKLSGRASRNVKTNLRGNLKQITRPCYELEYASFKLALTSLGFTGGSATSAQVDVKFLRGRPSDRLFLMFIKFPALAGLWSLAIGQWLDHAIEVIRRAEADRHQIARSFDISLNGPITSLQAGLSDHHDNGRSVTFLRFGQAPVIYKPRSGRTESIWFDFLSLLNRSGFTPKLRIAKMAGNNGYHWMEHIEPSPCESEGQVRRFYKRLGGLLAAAYILKAVDCHRDNLIASGEQPVVVDADALWHVSPLTKTQSAVDLLYRTGFLPNVKPGSLQSRSSILGAARGGTHLPRHASRVGAPRDYIDEITKGFSSAWKCLVGTKECRAGVRAIIRRVAREERRWIYCATETYGAVLRASLQPSALSSQANRKAIIQRLASRGSVAKTVIKAEVEALIRLDLPYFRRMTAESMPPDNLRSSRELTDEIRRALSPRRRSRRGQ